MGIENSSYVIYNDIITELGKKANKLDVKNGGKTAEWGMLTNYYT